MSLENAEVEKDSEHGHKSFVEVAISTTSGFFPTEGHSRVESNQKVRVQLEKAAKALHLAGTDGWVASVNKKPVNPERSYVENTLSGTIEIDWGPHEGGGGHA